MSKLTAGERLGQKTPEAAFLGVLTQEFHFSPRLAKDVLTAAQEVLVGSSDVVRPGQVRQIVARLEAPFGPPLAQTPTVAVTLTVDAGVADVGGSGARRVRRCAF